MADKIREFYILHYHFDKVAGTERVLYNLIEYLSKNKSNRVHLILLKSEHELVFNIDKLDIDIHYLGIDSFQNSGKLALIKTIRETSFKFVDLLKGMLPSNSGILITTNVYLAFAAFLAKKRLPHHKMEIVSCEHFTVTATSKITNLFRHFFYSRIHVVMLTEQDRDFIQRKYSPINCVCIPNAIPFPLQSYNGKNSKTIIAIGRYTRQKGFDLLIRSFALIANAHSDWTLKIIGDDYGDEKLLRMLIEEHQLGNVILEPSSSHIENFYKEAAFYVMSSRFEGLPMVLLEALSFGLPIISFDCPTGPALVVGDVNGILVENGNISLLAEAMEKFITNGDVREEKALGAEEVAKKFSKDSINKLWDEFFSKI